VGFTCVGLMLLQVHEFSIFVGKRLLEADFKDDSPMSYEEKREVNLWKLVVILVT
jgi:hypothetical protein